ncbi:uncharacterized protein J3R85_002367 [Psidium guajava]|nr:uncharacterized protein J3R85_002367 [Psidium guajava]
MSLLISTDSPADQHWFHLLFGVQYSYCPDRFSHCPVVVSLLFKVQNSTIFGRFYLLFSAGSCSPFWADSPAVYAKFSRCLVFFLGELVLKSAVMHSKSEIPPNPCASPNRLVREK